LEEEAPTHFEAPTGNRHAIDYETAGSPALHIRVQELFGLAQHPSIANGKLPLTLHLLSPAHRPIQIRAIFRASGGRGRRSRPR
jgi:ATP-dependent helicase HrpB